NFLHSPESETFTDDVYVRRLYQGALGRVPSDTEVAFYVNVLQTHQATRDDLVKNFLHSPEAAGVAIDRIYEAYLRRAWDPAGRSLYVRLIGDGTLTYAGVAKSALAAPEFFDNAVASVP